MIKTRSDIFDENMAILRNYQLQIAGYFADTALAGEHIENMQVFVRGNISSNIKNRYVRLHTDSAIINLSKMYDDKSVSIKKLLNYFRGHKNRVVGSFNAPTGRFWFAFDMSDDKVERFVRVLSKKRNDIAIYLKNYDAFRSEQPTFVLPDYETDLSFDELIDYCLFYYNEYEPLIHRLKERRDKIYAHNDRDTLIAGVFETETVYGLTYGDINNLSELASLICQMLTFAFENKDMSLIFQNALADR